MQRIVVGVDGSAESRAALRWAADVAVRLGAGLEVLQAWQYPPALHEWEALPSNYGYLPLLPRIQQVEQGIRDGLATIVAEVLGEQPGAAVTQRVVDGHAAQVLIDAADDAALLVVGRRGHSGLTGLLMGSVARACSEHANCPVVVVPSSREVDGMGEADLDAEASADVDEQDGYSGGAEPETSPAGPGSG